MRWILVLAAFAAVLPSAVAAPPSPVVWLSVEEDGVVRVTDTDLSRAGRSFSVEETSRLGLTLDGAPVPLAVDLLPAGSAEGRFALRFVGHAPRGVETWEDPFSRANPYRLAPVDPGETPRRFFFDPPPRPAPGTWPRASSPFRVHHEENHKLIRFSGARRHPDNWFWAEIKATDPAATTIAIPVTSPDEGPVELAIGFVGYSHLPETPDHSVDVLWNGAPIGRAEWDGEASFVFRGAIPPGRARSGPNSLSLRALGLATRGIDLVLLDWVELTHGRRHDLSAGQVEVSAAGGAVQLDAVAGREVTIFDEGDGHLWTLPPRPASHVVLLPAAAPSAEPEFAGRARFRAVRSGGERAVAAIRVAEPNDLRAPAGGAEFLVVSHGSLLPAARRLAQAREREGLRTRVVDVADVYDSFRAGRVDPEAIREFAAHAWRSWTPRPRYLLLLGDASWDFKNRQVSDQDYADWHWSPAWPHGAPKNESSPYADAGRNDRLLVPTMQHDTPWGHAASDHRFGCVDGDDAVAEIAVGRIPVVTLAEAQGVVDKILGYEALPEASLTRSVFIANDDPGFQRSTDTLATESAACGYFPERVYPRAEEKDNRQNTRALLDLFDAGPAMVVFLGHGGRYIWRTGPPDLAKNHDLFTLDHLDQLAPTDRLPVVVSLTCYSAPFDHPVADSIGEKLIRLPHGGAVAVVASSWRNFPPITFATVLANRLAEPGNRRLGDAFLAAKRSIVDSVSLHTYNLLGDPTTRYRGPIPGSTASDSERGTR